MSNAVICDECGSVVKESDVLPCEATTTKGHFYGGHICSNCIVDFEKRSDIFGWHLKHKDLVNGV